jgi:hypothetical protein
MADRGAWVGLAALGIVVAVLGWRVWALEAEVAALTEGSAARGSVAAVSEGGSGRRARQKVYGAGGAEGAAVARPRVTPTSPVDAPTGELPSEGGEDALRDEVARLVQEESARAEEVQRARWREAAQARTTAALAELADELDLEDAARTALETLVTSHVDERMALFAAAREGSMTFDEARAESEAAREAVGAEITELIGEDGLEALRTKLGQGGPGGGW